MQDTVESEGRQGCIALDLRQAFDSLHWDYMIYALQKFGIPEEYTKWVRLLYTNPTARARMGTHISEEYVIARGTRQGCPLSPLLFILALEPLLVTIRQQACHKGISLHASTHVVSAYADDILYVQDLEDTYEPLPSIFYNFQQLSGLQINEHKSYVFSFNDNVGGEVTRFGSLTFQLAQTTFKYLGIQIYRESQKMLDGNLLKAITALRAQVTF